MIPLKKIYLSIDDVKKLCKDIEYSKTVVEHLYEVCGLKYNFSKSNMMTFQVINERKAIVAFLKL